MINIITEIHYNTGIHIPPHNSPPNRAAQQTHNSLMSINHHPIVVMLLYAYDLINTNLNQNQLRQGPELAAHCGNVSTTLIINKYHHYHDHMHTTKTTKNTR